MFIPPMMVTIGFDLSSCWFFEGLFPLFIAWICLRLVLLLVPDESSIMENQTRGQGRRSDPVNPYMTSSTVIKKSFDMIQEKQIVVTIWPSKIQPWCGSQRCCWSRSAVAAAILRWTPALGQRSWATRWNLVPRKQIQGDSSNDGS